MTSTTYPNGQTLVSNALTKDEIQILIQRLTYGMIGLPTGDPSNAKAVRIVWPTEGQPYQDSNQDICYITCTSKPNPYTQIRDRQLLAGDPADQFVVEQWGYTRTWNVKWVFYGPNSLDRARMVWSAIFIDYFNDQLNVNNLWPVPDMSEPMRVPENFNAQWWERADFEVEMYEAVTETISDGIVKIVEVSVEDSSGQLAQTTIQKP